MLGSCSALSKLRKDGCRLAEAMRKTGAHNHARPAMPRKCPKPPCYAFHLTLAARRGPAADPTGPWRLRLHLRMMAAHGGTWVAARGIDETSCGLYISYRPPTCST